MYTVITYYRDGGKEAIKFDTREEAIAHMEEEILWELTASTKCAKLGIEMRGTFNTSEA